MKQTGKINSSKKIFVVTILSTSLLLNGYFLYQNSTENKSVYSNSAESSESDLLGLIDEKFLRDTPSQKDIQDGKLRGIVDSLKDPYSQYLTREEFENFTSSLNQKYEGIGISFEKKDGQFITLQVFESSPASIQDIRPGDLIAKVNNEFIANLTIEEVASKIKGEEGSTVEITIIREDQEIVKNIQRQAIKVDLVTYEKKDNVGVIKITSFGEDLNNELNEIAKQILADSGIEKIVLDLRSNNGGYLLGAIESASYFLEPNTLILKEQSKDSEKTLKSIKKENSLVKYPINILVDGFTASSSEILASSIRDNREAKLIGEKTFGKGVVQEVFNFNGGLVKLTTNEWITAKGEKINEKGLEVDIETKEDQDTLDVAVKELNK